MRNTFFKFTILTVVIISLFTSFGWSQTNQNTNQSNSVETTLSSDDVYVVKEGDSLAALSPNKWEELKKFNPFLADPARTRVRADGFVFLLIKPGEKIKGLKTLGLSITNAPTSVSESPTQEVAQPVAKAETVQPGWVYSIFWGYLYPVIWLLGILLLIAILLAALYAIALWLFRRFRSNPVKAGPPFTERPLTHATVEEFILRRAREQYRGSNPEMIQLRRLDFYQEANGSGRVQYSDGTSQIRNLSNDSVYLAYLLMPDGTVQTRMFLRGCGNQIDRIDMVQQIPGLALDLGSRTTRIRLSSETEESNQDNSNGPTGSTRDNNQDGVFFTENNGAVVQLSGYRIEFDNNESSEYSLETKEGKRQVSVYRPFVKLTIVDGKITEFGLDGEPRKVVKHTATKNGLVDEPETTEEEKTDQVEKTRSADAS